MKQIATAILRAALEGFCANVFLFLWLLILQNEGEKALEGAKADNP